MNIDIELKELWGMQRTNTPKLKDIISAGNKFRRKNIGRLLFLNTALPLTCVFIGSIWYYEQPQMITTKIGISLAILAMVTLVAVGNRMIPFLKKMNPDANIKEYLQQLRQFKIRQMFMQRTMMNVYFVLLTTGLCLYLIEPTRGMKYAWAVYTASLAWVLFNYFYTRPRQIKKQEREVDEMINKVERLQKQADEVM